MEQKACSRCGAVHPASHFGMDNVAKQRRKTECKACSAKRMREYRLKNIEKARERDRGRYRSDPLRRYIQKAMRQYGLDYEQAAIIAGHTSCDICGRDNGGRRMALDHCHASGKLRGLLCDGCNIGLGNFRDDPHLLRLARKYVTQGGFGGYEPITDEERAALV